MNLTDEQFKVWLAALRSDDFKQERITLTYTDREGITGYCCMGVAGRVCLDLTDDQMANSGLLSSLNKRVFTDLEEVTLARLNDTYNLSFPQIAAFVDGADEATWKDIASGDGPVVDE